MAIDRTTGEKVAIECKEYLFNKGSKATQNVIEKSKIIPREGYRYIVVVKDISGDVLEYLKEKGIEVIVLGNVL